MADKIS
jgi:P-type Cu+ transporter